MSLIARYLEAQGIPTAIIGSARDIVEHCGVPRFLFFDAPLGNPCGTPGDRAMQDRIVAQGIALFSEAAEPRTTLAVAELWGPDDWKSAYMAVTDTNREELARKGEELRARRAKREQRSL